jgi:hypothetical protein
VIIDPFLRSQGTADSFQLAQGIGGSSGFATWSSAKPVLDRRLWADLEQLSYVSEVCTVTNTDQKLSRARSHSHACDRLEAMRSGSQTRGC